MEEPRVISEMEQQGSELGRSARDDDDDDDDDDDGGDDDDDDCAYSSSYRRRRHDDRGGESKPNTDDDKASERTKNALEDDSSSSSVSLSNVEKLMSACDSIVRNCLSYRTLTPIIVAPPHLGDPPPDGPDEEGAHQLERDVARWLDDKMLDAERNLRIMERRRAGSDSATATTAPPRTETAAEPSGDPRDVDAESHRPPSSPRTAQDLRRELLRRTSQLQLEHKFLKRVLISRGVQQQNLHGDSDEPHEDDDPTGADELRRLRRRATRARDRQVFEALQLDAELSEIRKQHREARDECSRLQRENRKLWEAMRVAEDERQRQQQPTSPTTAGEATLEVENRVLQQLLRDLVLGSSLDWFADERLQAIVDGTNMP